MCLVPRPCPRLAHRPERVRCRFSLELIGLPASANLIPIVGLEWLCLSPGRVLVGWHGASATCSRSTWLYLPLDRFPYSSYSQCYKDGLAFPRPAPHLGLVFGIALGGIATSSIRQRMRLSLRCHALTFTFLVGFSIQHSSISRRRFHCFRT
ncbi:hypothetical protein BO82DRAFT_51517 [Aspergillus uvarum CBS 121591]|uniref:Uncharacterized protein n=1 Tax=Aspergillus uvarum CBS 121591 TaxID=1448315 RepID=A0A319CMT8_9EURO|nr:hypothetical protein BO82DRAFT_51517 [Aspergillus uvarum CBS 121591]PYH86796.1 hypothetical protein BO82DRAFT_51517 [Aspergillus uvarum CBS 121591]